MSNDKQDIPLRAACRALCQSRKFDTGQGTCALICMDQLGDARAGPHGCSHVVKVHSAMAVLTVQSYLRITLTTDDDITALYHRLYKMVQAKRLLGVVREKCLFTDDDDKIGFTEDPHIDVSLFNEICEVLRDDR